MIILIPVNVWHELTKVLSSPDVHVGVILAQVVEPALVHDKDPTSDDRSSAECRGKQLHTFFLFKTPAEKEKSTPELYISVIVQFSH